MDILDLRTFITVVDEGTTVRAARTLGMTQPGVSKHISRLEERVGGALFARRGKYLVLNEFGAFFYEHAKKIVGDVDALAAVSYGSTCAVGSVSLGMTDAATLIITPPSLIEFRQRHPGVHIALDVDSSTHIEDGLLNDRYDIGFITADARPNPRLVHDKLYEDYIDAVVAISHELVRRKRVTLDELARHTLIISPERRRTRMIIEEAFRRQRLTIRDSIDVYNHTASMRLAESGLGIALLPRMYIVHEIGRHRCVHMKIASDPIRRMLCAVRRADREPSHVAASLYGIILEQCRSSGTLRPS